METFMNKFEILTIFFKFWMFLNHFDNFWMNFFDNDMSTPLTPQSDSACNYVEEDCFATLSLSLFACHNNDCNHLQSERCSWRQMAKYSSKKVFN